ASDVTTPGECAGTYSRTKTWNAVDACGNQSGTVSQTIIVQDITAPSIGQPGADATISCPASPQFTAPTASDACDQNPSVVEVSDVTTPGECAGTYSRTKTWKAVDACGNQSGTVSQTITVQDITAPSIGQPGADATISCPASLLPSVVLLHRNSLHQLQQMLVIRIQVLSKFLMLQFL
ncbi:MAG: hypothetical protein NT126_07310, partial [Bacteroidetes bacterium]|nr:hypothetical protein [Bacteroidota bacterium]